MSWDVAGFFLPWLVFLWVFVANLVVPGKWVTGYVEDEHTGELLRYWINGRTVLDVTMVAFVAAAGAGWVPWDLFAQHGWASLYGAIVFGLIFSFAFVLPYPSSGKSFAADVFLGRVKNAQLLGGRLDAKMWLYLVGALLLQLHVISLTASHLLTYGLDGNPGVVVSAAMLTWFILDYLTFEEVHVYTYDIFAENVGFKLGWGCLAFYPYFYAIGLWSTAHLPDPGWPWWWYAGCMVLFLAGWSLARGANMQKFYFKQDGTQPFLGIVPEAISDGQRSLLVNGFWGVSRHVNYLGEITMAVAIAAVLGHPTVLWPWLYPLYYVILFVTRQRDDDARCAKKYGPLWEEYEHRVPWRIVPGLY